MENNNVISLADFRNKKKVNKTVEKIESYGDRKTPETDPELAFRVERIKGSINRINELMIELRNMPNNNPGKES